MFSPPDPFLPDPRQADKILARMKAAHEKAQKIFVDGRIVPALPVIKEDQHDYCCQSLFLYPPLQKGELLKKGLMEKLKDHGRNPCITEDKYFTDFLITEAGTEAAVALYCYENGHVATDANQARRHECYRVIVASLLGPLGRGVRVRLPACVIEAVRKRWPRADGNYTGFKPCALFEE